MYNNIGGFSVCKFQTCQLETYFRKVFYMELKKAGYNGEFHVKADTREN